MLLQFGKYSNIQGYDCHVQIRHAVGFKVAGAAPTRILEAWGTQGSMMQYEHLSSNLDRIISDPGDNQKEVYRIGDLASEFGVTLRTLRFYEDRGLLSPERSGSTRLYSQKDRAKLKIILLAKRVGFSLVDIQEIMDISDGSLPTNEQLSIILEKFKGQIDVLKVQRVELEDSMRELDQAISSISALIEQQ